MIKRHLNRRYPLDLDAWKSLKAHYLSDLKNTTIPSLFQSEGNRASDLLLEAAELKLDYSKNLLNNETLKLFAMLLKEAKVKESVERMFSGENINASEKKPALHMALRSKLSDQIALNIEGVDNVWSTQERMEGFVSALHSGDVSGCTGKNIKNIVNIGIGGSELGPSMSILALRDYWVKDIKCHSVSNGDGIELLDLLSEIELEETLFIISSKSFSTKETIDNAIIARSVMEERFGSRSIKHHFMGISVNKKAMHEFGIQADYQYKIADWVGGRFSLCSAIGLSLACIIGMQNFRKFLEGARTMDMHFRQAPYADNMPMMLAMIAIFNTNIIGSHSQAILTYNTRLSLFPAYLQQLHMESLGKSTRIDGEKVCLDTGGVIWGGAASDGQHSFYQLLHQGTQSIPIDFILPVSAVSQRDNYYNQANCLAQSEALMDGSLSERKEQIHVGDRSSNTILFDRISPEILGQLVALYEHKVFVQASIYGINPFDQYGVELGKKLADSLAETIEKEMPYKGKNLSTKKLIELIRDSEKDR
jgi:glucose-6-phosphate isomerase